MRIYIDDLTDHAEVPELKDIEAVLDDEPLLDAEQLELGRWIARTYCAGLGEVLDCMLPGAVRRKVAVSTRTEVALAGGSEAPITPICIKGYGASGALSKSGIMRPFSSGRDGFVLAEGASVLVLQEMDSAIKSGKRIYAELAGYGNTSDAHHPTAPLAEGQQMAIRAALADAGLEPGEADFISAHATSTPRGDSVEAEAILDVFKDRTSSSMHAAAIKSMTGHMLAASGAFEAASAAKAIATGLIPPSLNSGGREAGRLSISDKAREVTIRTALCNSFGFGGVNVVLAMKAV